MTITADSGPGAGFDIAVLGRVEAHLGSLAAADADRRRYRNMCQSAIRSVPLDPQQAVISGGAFTITGPPNLMGPNTGYAWAVQRLTIGGLTSGATPDLASFYRGPSNAATAQNTNLLATVSGNQPYWHPGRTGLILQPGDTIVAAGASLAASGTVTLTGEIILLEQWLLPRFLL